VFQLAESQGTNVIFMHPKKNVGHKVISKADIHTQLVNEGDRWKEIFASCTKSHILQDTSDTSEFSLLFTGSL
jgi:hypothetical protein